MAPSKNFLRSLSILLLVGILLSASYSLSACTIFILTDGNKVLFFNNEDYSNPNTRIWFVPGGNDYHGCAYVGFDDGVAQGGLNTKGLAFDWYAGKPVSYTANEKQPRAKGNSSERMLESCSTVEEAIRFYQTYAEPSFARATLLVADKTGASVVIGARNGKLYFDRSTQSRGIGYGASILQRTLGKDIPVKMDNGKAILKQCLQSGEYGTKYSNVFDLHTGAILMHPSFKSDSGVTLNIFTELEKGPHYYDIPSIGIDVNKPLKSLLLNMQRLVLYEFEPLPDQEPHVAEKIKVILKEASSGILKPDNYSKDFWNAITSSREEMQVELRKLGNLLSLHLIRKERKDNLTDYTFILIFENARAMMLYTFDEHLAAHNITTLTAAMIQNTSFDTPIGFTSRYLYQFALAAGLALLAWLIVRVSRRRYTSR